MANYDKKTRELAILRRAYPKKEYPSVLHSDKPDFILTDLDGSTFGVEVTEFYTTGSTARIKNIDNYLNDLLTAKKFRHKEDIKNFTVDDFKIQTNDGKEKGAVRGVFMEAMSLADKMKILNAMISDKNKKFGQYDGKLPHIELLIHDSDGLFGLAKPEQVGSTLMHYLLPELVEDSKFSDVLLVFDTNEHEYVVSILDNVFMGTLASVVGFVKKHRVDIENLLADDVISVDFVGAVFRHRGFKKIRSVDFQIDSKKRAGIEINGAIICADEGGNTLYRGPQKITGSPQRKDTLPGALPSKISTIYDNFMQEHAWVDSIFKQSKKLPTPTAKPRGKK